MQGTNNTVTISVSFIQSLVAIAAVGVVWAGSMWRMVKVNAQKETLRDAELAAVKKDINAIGERVNNTNLACGKHDEAIQLMRAEQQHIGTMRENIASNKTAIAAIREEMAEERLAVMSMLHANEKAATERDTRLQVELAGIRERLNIEHIVETAVRKLKAI